jgi:drug/metabolite transporter (DMT)-like permease
MSNGVLFLLIAELFFAIGTVIVKIITANTDITGVELAFLRFLTGFVIIGTYVVVSGKPVKPVKSFYVYMRGFFNALSVIFFFMGVQYSNISKANLLNMTYPVFVMLLSPLINKEKNTHSVILYLTIIMAGIYLIVIPGHSGSGFSDINKGDIFALLSGITAGFGISFLREARKSNGIPVILFYLMGTGTVISGIFAASTFIIPTGIYILYIVIMAVLSFTGQLLITVGYKYIDAAPGSLVSSSRIVFAIILGVTIFSDPLTLRIIIGSLMITISLAGVNGFFRYMKVKKRILRNI